MNETHIETIKDRVIEIVKANSVVNTDLVNEYSNIRNELGIDSVRLVNLIVDLEDEFDFKEEGNGINIDNFITVSSIIGYVMKNTSK